MCCPSVATLSYPKVVSASGARAETPICPSYRTLLAVRRLGAPPYEGLRVITQSVSNLLPIHNKQNISVDQIAALWCLPLLLQEDDAELFFTCQ
ncbi:hypothetical protein ATANTOWER_021163, partial [Ataeniobius toweri]|nr:hypothetical protein [Ataeniobius toweri]